MSFMTNGLVVWTQNASSGPPASITQTMREHICRIARCQPAALGLPFTVWSLTKLAEYLITHRVVERISNETLCQILKHHGITWQPTEM